MEYTITLSQGLEGMRITELKIKEEDLLEFCEEEDITLEEFLEDIHSYALQLEDMGEVIFEEVTEDWGGPSIEVSQG